jgi:hypothetical protein
LRPRKNKGKGSPKHRRVNYAQVVAPEGGTTSAVTLDLSSMSFGMLDTSGAPMRLDAERAGVALIEPDTQNLRVLASVPISGLPTFDPKRPLLGFDFVLAVDATPVGSPDRQAIVVAQVERTADGTPTRIWPVLLFQVEGVPDGIHGERLAWKLLVADVMSHDSYVPNHRFAIITDQQWGEHAALNRGEREIVPGFPLPPNFTLVFARDQSPTDSAMQQAVRVCHNLGAQSARAALEGNIAPAPAVSGEPLFRTFRRWTPNGRGAWMGQL